MIMFDQEPPSSLHLPATAALSFSLQSSESNKIGKMDTRNIMMMSPSHDQTIFSLAESYDVCSTLTVELKPPHTFELDGISKSTKCIEYSLDFPLIQWDFEEKTDVRNLLTTHSSLAKRRKCRGLVRSMSSSDLSVLIETPDDGSR